MLHVSVERDSPLGVNTSVGSLGGGKSRQYHAGSGHRSQLEQFASTLFHFSDCSCKWTHFRRDRHEAGLDGPSSAYRAEVASWGFAAWLFPEEGRESE